MIEKDIFNNIASLLRTMRNAADGVYNLNWQRFETMDTLLVPVGVGSTQTLAESSMPALFMAYGESADQYIGSGMGGNDIGFDDVPSLGTIREMTPIIVRVLLSDNNGDNDVLSEQISKAREDIRAVIADKLRTDDDSKVDGVYRVYVGPPDLSADAFYTNTAEFIIPIVVWWRHDYREPDRKETATIIEDSNSPRLLHLEITPTFIDNADPNVDGSVTIDYQLETDTARLSILENDTVVVSDLAGTDVESWIDNTWSMDTVFKFRVTDGSHTSDSPEIKYPYYPAMLPESLYDLGDSPEQNIERKIRQMIQKEIDTDSRFDGIKTTSVGPLSPNYLKPENLPMLCLTYDESALNIGSRRMLNGMSISNLNVGWRTANARDQILQFMAMIHAPADRDHTDPYKQIRVIDKTLSELRSFVIANEQWEGVSSVYQSIIGPSISPRRAENVQGDLLFIGRFNFIVRYRES